MSTRRAVTVLERLLPGCLFALVALLCVVPDGASAVSVPWGASNTFVKSNSTPFSVDVWTDTGGQGMSMSGGTYGPDDEVTVYVSATWDCLASVRVGLLSGETHAMMDIGLAADETLRLPPIPLWDLDEPEGAWIVELDAIAGEDVASDSVRFDVVQSADPLAQLDVDVMTDLGGRGQGVPGGIYILGTRTILTVELNKDADIMLVLEGPGVSTSDDGHLKAGSHTIDLGTAEEGDEGVWTVDVTALAGGQQVSDRVQFSVVSNESWSAVAITPANATAFNALIALKMSQEHLDEDAAFDVDRDGSITAADANLILLWSVSQ